jgi:hypothetical protein
MSSDSDPYRIRDIIDGLPRSPCPRMLQTLARPKNKPSLKIPAGNRFDTLGERGLEALQQITFGQSAMDHIARTGRSKEEALDELMRRASLQLIGHLNATPRRMKLVIEAAIPASAEKYQADGAYYQANRSLYIAWLARKAKQFPEHFGSVMLTPRKPAPERTGRYTRDPLPFQISSRELDDMRHGFLAPGWSIEHIKARCFDIPGLPKNGMGNLIVMPKDTNAWTCRLEQIQRPLLFSQKRADRRQLIICAEPFNGPSRGFFIYGATIPMGLAQDKLAYILSLEIGDLSVKKSLIPLPALPMRRSVGDMATARV